MRKLLDSIKAVITKIKGLLSGYEAQSPEAKLLAADLEKYEKARDLWLAGLLASVDNTGIDFSQTARYSQSKQETMLEYAEAVDEQVIELVNIAKNNPADTWSKAIIEESVSSKLAEDIQNVLGIDVTGYKNVVTASDIRHILKRHGEHGLSDRSMEDAYDIARLGYIVNNYDQVSAGIGSSEYKNSDGSKACTVVLSKEIGNGVYYVIEAVPESKKRTLHVVSAFLSKKETTSQVPDAKSPRRTSETEPVQAASFDTSISNPDENVKGKFSMKSPIKETEEQQTQPVRQENNTGKEQQKYVEKLAKALGRRVRFVDTISNRMGKRANGALVNGEILIALDSDSPATIVLSHELTHAMQESSPEEYRTYKEYVVNYFREAHPDEDEKRIQDLKDLYKTDDVSFLEDELVSNATETFLMDEKAVDRFIQENRPAARKLLDSIKEVITKIKNLLSGYEAQSPEAKLLAADLEKYEKARDLWMKG